jgi:hypothetical protein
MRGARISRGAAQTGDFDDGAAAQRSVPRAGRIIV